MYPVKSNTTMLVKCMVAVWKDFLVLLAGNQKKTVRDWGGLEAEKRILKLRNDLGCRKEDWELEADTCHYIFLLLSPNSRAAGPQDYALTCKEKKKKK